MNLLQKIRGFRFAQPPKETPERSALTQELGATGTRFFSGFLQNDEFNADLKGQKAATTYNKMRRTDAQIGAILNVLKLPIRSANWFIECEDQKLWAFLHEALFEPIDFDRYLQHALLMLDYGYEVMEKVYYDDGGQWWLKQPLHRAQSTIFRWIVDGTDSLLAVEQQAYKGQSYVTAQIPTEKVILNVYQMEGNNFEGISVLRTAYKHWFIKDTIYRIDAIAHERFGIGIPTMGAPDHYTNEDKILAIEMMENYRAGEKAYIFRPPGWTFEIAGSSNSNRYDPMPAIKHHDEMIARCILAQFLNFGSTETGARALGESSQDLYLFALRAIAKQIAKDTETQVINQLKALNFPNADRVRAQLKFTDLDIRSAAEMATALKTYVDAGVIVPDDDLEDWARDSIDAPARLLPEDATIAASDYSRDAISYSCGHKHAHGVDRGLKRKHLSQPGPEGFWRPLRPEEKFVALNELDGRQDDALEHTVDMFGQVKGAWTDALIAQIASALSDGDPSDIGQVDVPSEMKAGLQTDTVGQFRDLYHFGRRTVREELMRQNKRNRMSEVSLLDEDLEYDEDLVPEEITGLFVVRAQRFVDRLAQRVKGVAIDRALSIHRTRGADYTEADLEDLRTELDQLADSTVRNEARLVISEAVSAGRQEEAETQAEEIDYVVYSAVLDDNTCEECLALDGKEFQMGSSEYYENAPPNRKCLGGNRCRCAYFYVLKSQKRARR